MNPFGARSALIWLAAAVAAVALAVAGVLWAVSDFLHHVV